MTTEKQNKAIHGNDLKLPVLKKTGRQRRRSRCKKLVDFLSFPLRAFVLIEEDKWGLSSLASERFVYVSEVVQGHCLDVG